MTGRGRKSMYTPETVERITFALSIGAARVHAAEYGGISKETFYQWMKKPDFLDAVTRAETVYRMSLLAIIKKQVNEGDGRLALDMLGRRWPQDYGRNVTEITGADGGAIQTEIILRQIPERKDD
jgi:hypothetical protein